MRTKKEKELKRNQLQILTEIMNELKSPVKISVIYSRINTSKDIKKYFTSLMDLGFAESVGKDHYRLTHTGHQLVTPLEMLANKINELNRIELLTNKLNELNKSG